MSVVVMAPKSLPSEVWMEIFELLDYVTLKKLARVSKYFGMLANHHCLNENLFRGTAHNMDGATAIPLRDFETHPAFKRFDYNCTGNIEEVQFVVKRPGNESQLLEAGVSYLKLGNDLFKQIRLSHASVANEFATSPGVTHLKLKIDNAPCFSVKSKKGVTVLQVMKAVCRFFGKDDKSGMMTSDICPWVWNCLEVGELPPPDTRASYRDVRMDIYCAWLGFRWNKLDSKGRPVLVAEEF